jgi:hypothetical protein
LDDILQNGGYIMKLICKCGNIENLRTDRDIENYEFRNCGDGTIVLVCKKCSEAIFISVKNS